MRKLRILTWQTHTSYLHYLTQLPHDFYVVSNPDRLAGDGNHSAHIPLGNNIRCMAIDDVRHADFDCIIYQNDYQYLEDQHLFLTQRQRHLPRVYIEHDPPRDSPTEARHPVQDPDILLIHVTPFNALMWDNGVTPARVIEHGVITPNGISYSGEKERGLVIVNHLARGGRRLGGDIFELVRKQVPLDLVGTGTEESGGMGEVMHGDLPALAATYRFVFSPIRYASMELEVIESMMAGVPIVSLSTTEIATVIRSGTSGFVDTNIDNLIEKMHMLLRDLDKARALGEGARARARERFNITRFIDDWNNALQWIIETKSTAS